MKLYCGIDPGAVSGAWGIVDLHGKYWSCGSIPNVDGKITSRNFAAELRLSIDRQDIEFSVEITHSFSGQGIASTYKFGRAVGAIEAVCEAFNAPMHYVSPQRWKKHFQLSQDKYASLILAQELWPDAPIKRKKDHNIAEALLLAEYLRREHGV